jgi:hypothetical protein
MRKKDSDKELLGHMSGRNPQGIEIQNHDKRCQIRSFELLNSSSPQS